MYKFIEDKERDHGCTKCCLLDSGCGLNNQAEDETGKNCAYDDGYYVVEEWVKGDLVRHKTSFNTVVFTHFSGENRDYFFHEQSNKPLKSCNYVRLDGDNGH